MEWLHWKKFCQELNPNITTARCRSGSLKIVKSYGKYTWQMLSILAIY